MKKIILAFSAVLMMTCNFAEAAASTASDQQVWSYAQSLIQRRGLVSIPLSGNHLQANTLYNVIPGPVNWQSGFTTYFVASRSESMPANSFLSWIASHIYQVRSAFYPMGLKGYIAIATPDLEIAIQNWDSEQAMQKAFQSQPGQQIGTEAGHNLKILSMGPANNTPGVQAFVDSLQNSH